MHFKKRFGHDFAQSGTIFDRSRIAKDMFYDVMSLLLHMYGTDGSIEFLDKYFMYKGLSMNEIQDYEKIFEEFRSLLKLQ